MWKRKLLSFSLCAGTMFIYGQGFSLRQCIDFATHNSGNQKISDYEMVIAQKKVSEQIGTMLPQIDGSVSYTDNLKLAQTMMPGELAGKPGELLPITFGSKHNASAGLQLTQKLFDPSFSVVLKASRVNEAYTKQNKQKVQEQTFYNVCYAYYQCLIINKQCSKLKATVSSSGTMLTSMELRFKNGLAKQIEVDKIRVSYNTTNSQLAQSELNYTQALNSLKYQMGMPADKNIYLTDTTSTDINLNEAAMAIDGELNIENKVDYQLQQTNIKLQELQKKQTVMGYLPTLNFSAAFNYNAMRNSFSFFDHSQPWYNSYNIGLSLRVPVFDGFQRKHRVEQANMNIQKAKENAQMTELSIKLNVANYVTQYKNALDNIKNEKANLDLAQSVYESTQLQYNEGITTSLDLLQAESSLRESQNSYFNKLFLLLEARLDLEQAKGTLINYINNIK